MSASLIEDYGRSGDFETAARGCKTGSIDGLCWPRFDSGACFAALLGATNNGRWLIAPAQGNPRTTRRYRPDTLILETSFVTADGEAILIDFMPLRERASHLVRLVVGKRGTVSMTTELIIRFDYGASVPWVKRTEAGDVLAISGPDMLVLRTPVELRGEGLTTVGDFTVAAGQTITFVLTYASSHLPVPHHAQGSHLRAHRRDRGGTDHLAAGADWRPPQLGLPLLLAARRNAYAARVHECGILRRGAPLA